jgi:hypothetical protein
MLPAESVFRDKGIDQTDHLSFSLLFLSFGLDGIDPKIHQPDLSKRFFQQSEKKMVLPKINSKT